MRQRDASNEALVLPPAPAQVRALVDVVGVERAIDFILAEGGGYVTLGTSLRDDNAVVRRLGRADAERLAAKLRHPALWRVSLVKPWVAAMRSSQGRGVHEIAKELHVSDVAVRRWLKNAAAETLRRNAPGLFDQA